MMSDQEQAPYFEHAHRERRAHQAKYPGWSPKDNCNKAKRRKAEKIAVPPNHHHFAIPANQQPVSQKIQMPFHELSTETIIFNGISIPLEAFLILPH
ncbi:transcription factor 7-like 2 [Eucyclogobius newberryi]|uniref:transcription factor 7-like 2 n=1 Tax=Eucyclogobius newberryi TaxID=166745 RepID=UPI003B58D59A